MKSSLAAVKRQRFPAQAGQLVRGLFILGLGDCSWPSSIDHPRIFDFRIWDLAKVYSSNIGLNKQEFCLAMYLIYLVVEEDGDLPDDLPNVLHPEKHRDLVPWKDKPWGSRAEEDKQLDRPKERMRQYDEGMNKFFLLKSC